MRISSLVNVKGKDVDFKNNVIYYQNKKAKRMLVFPIHKELQLLLKQINPKLEQPLVPLKDRSSFKFYYRALKTLGLKLTFTNFVKH
jgi:integrase